MTQAVSDPVATTRRVHRIEVWMRPEEIDPRGDATLAEARQRLEAIQSVRTARVYLIEAPLDDAAAQRIANELLADAVSQTAVTGTASPAEHSHTVEVHHQPGVMDPVAQSMRDAIVEMLSPSQPDLNADDVQVCTGFRYDLTRSQEAAPLNDAALRLR